MGNRLIGSARLFVNRRAGDDCTITYLTLAQTLAAQADVVVDEFRQIPRDGRWPLEDDSVDLVVSDWVLEHVLDPGHFVAKLARVLRPGGAFVARTVSRWWVLSFGARLVPNRAHARVLGKLQPGREDRDVFPTTYRMNTRRALRKLLDAQFDWTVMMRPGPGQLVLIVSARHRAE